MCLAVPGKIVDIRQEGPFLMASVDFCGVVRKIAVDTVEAAVGDYIVAHAGVAISVMDANEALAAIADLKAMADARDSNSPQ